VGLFDTQPVVPVLMMPLPASSLLKPFDTTSRSLFRSPVPITRPRTLALPAAVCHTPSALQLKGLNHLCVRASPHSYEAFAAECLAADGLAIVEYALELQVRGTAPFAPCQHATLTPLPDALHGHSDKAKDFRPLIISQYHELLVVVNWTIEYATLISVRLLRRGAALSTSRPAVVMAGTAAPSTCSASGSAARKRSAG
jgi:hypothetical protein